MLWIILSILCLRLFVTALCFENKKQKWEGECFNKQSRFSGFKIAQNDYYYYYFCSSSKIGFLKKEYWKYIKIFSLARSPTFICNGPCRENFMYSDTILVKTRKKKEGPICNTSISYCKNHTWQIVYKDTYRS